MKLQNFPKLGLALATIIFAVAAQADVVTGTIQVWSGNTMLGYVGGGETSEGTMYVVGPGLDTQNLSTDPLQVQIDTGGSSPFSITESYPTTANSNFGADSGYVYGYSIGVFAPGSPAYALLTGTSFVPAGSTPSNTASWDEPYFPPGSIYGAESSIWSLSGDQLTAQWVNADGTEDPTEIYYGTLDGVLGLTGDLGELNSYAAPGAGGNGYEAVTFEFISAAGPSTAVPDPRTLALLGAGLAAMAAVRRRSRKEG